MEVEKVALVAVTANAAEKVTVKTGGKIKAAAGTKYLLQVINSDVSPENATVQRDGKDLQVFFEGSDKPDLTIQDFFAEGMDSQLYGVAEDGQLYAYVRTDGEGYYGPLLLNEGESAPIALGGDSLGDGAPYLASNFDETAGFVLWPWLLGLAGIGAATAAIIEHNRPDDHKTRTSPAPTNIKVIDDVGPIQGQLANGDVTDDARPTVTGSGMAGAVIRLYDNGTEIGSTQVGADGTWSFTPTADLPDGEHKFTVIQEVSGRKPSAPVDVLDFSVDTVPPADPVATIVGGVENGGDLYSPSNTPTLTGTGEPGDTIIIEFPTGEKVTTTVGPDGKWTANPPSQGLPEGPVDIIITERDPAGNETTVKLPAIVDTIAPDAPQVWLDPASDSGVKGDNITNDTKPKIVGKAEANSQVTVTIKETGEVIQVKADQNGDWSVMPTRVLPEGPIHIEAVATDAAGNTSQPGTLDLTIDTTPPNYHDLAITGVLDSVGEITGNIANGGETDDAHPVISGTGTAGDTVIVYAKDSTGNHEIGRATVGSDGTWSLKPELPLVSGLNVLTAVEVDVAGNQTVPSQPYSITVDTGAPAAPTIVNVYDDVGPYQGFLQKGAVTDDNQPTFNGTAQPGTTIKLYDDGKLIGSGITDAKGNWSITTDKLADGLHEVTATATNSVGQASEPTGVWPFTVDTVAPDNVKNLVILDDIGEKTGPLYNGDTTDDNQPTFSGEAEPKGKVIVYDNGKKIGEADVDADGKWELTPTTPLVDGPHDFTTEVRDEAGNSSGQGNPTHIIVDTEGGILAITHVIDAVGSITGDIVKGGVTDDPRPQIHGSGKAGSIVIVKDGDAVLGTTTVDYKGNWSFTPTSDLAEGAHRLVAIGIDPAGNSSTSNIFDFTLDTTAPVKPTIDSVYDDVGPIQGPIPNGGVTDDSTPTLNGKAEAGSTVTVFDNGETLGSVVADADGNWSFTPTTPLNEGPHAFTADATDKAGNTGPKSDVFNITTDYTAPVAPAITGVLDSVGEVTGNVVSGGTTDDPRPVISGTGTAGDIITVYTQDVTGNRVIGSTKVEADGTWKLQPTTPLVSGLNDLTAVEMDPAGNTSVPSAKYSFTLDIAPPAPPVIENVLDDVGPYTGFLQKGAITDDNQPTFSGTAQAGSTVKLYDGGKLIGSGSADAAGHWTITTVKLADGLHEVTATATDSVGRVSDPTGIWPFTVDTTAPANTTLVVTDNVGNETGPLHNGDTTDDNRPVFTGDAEPNGKVIIYDNGKELGRADVDAQGKWSFIPTTALKDGDHSFTTVVLDQAGNNSGPGNKLDVTVDTSKLLVSITSVVDNVGSITGNITSGGETDDTRPVINGTGKVGSTVTVKDGETTLGTATIDSKGNWSLKPSSDLAEGPHSITAIAVDKAGNSSTSSPFNFIVDTTAPAKPTIDEVYDDVGSIQGPVAKGGVTDDPCPTLSGKAEAGSKVTVYDNNKVLGSVTADNEGHWSYTPTTPLNEGPHDFTVDATDKAGNTSPKSDVFGIITDYTPPAAPLITGVLDSVGEVTGNIESGGITDDPRPVISGKGTAGDTLIVYTHDVTGDREIGRTTVGADGTWKLQPTTPLVSGLNQLTAVEMDPAGNTSVPSAKYSFTLDIAPPAPPVIENVLDDVGPYTGFLQKGAITDDNQPTFSGSAQAGSTVKLYDTDGTLIGSGQADAKGHWSITTSTLADGLHEVTATATDGVGKVSDPTGIWPFTVDTTAPANTTLVVTDNVGDETGPLHNGDTTDDNRPVFTGDAEPNGKVILYDNGNELGRADVDAQGKWSFIPTTALKDGDHSFTTVVLDQAGNSSGPGNKLDVTVDTSKLLVSITSVVDNVGSITGNITSGGETDDTRPVINGTGKVGSTVTVKDGETTLGTATIDSKGNWSLKPSSDLAEGPHSITAIAVDKAGNSSTSSPFNFIVDTTAPAKPTIDEVYDDVGAIQGPVAKGGVTDDPCPTLSGKAEANAKVTVFDNGKALGSVMADASGHWSYTPTTPLNEGPHEFTVNATDKAGNTSAKSDPFNITTDYTAPAAPVIVSVFDDVGDVTGFLKPGDTTDDDKPQISGTAEAGSTVEVWDGTLKLGTTLTDASGNWSFTPTNPLGKGEHSITAKAIDPAGNVSDPSNKFDFIVDTGTSTVPAITHVIDSVGSITGDIVNGGFTDDKRPEIQGTADAGSKVTVYDNGTKLGETTADASGNWSFKPTSDLADGTYKVTATSTGASGNVSAHSNAWTFTVDTVAPEKPTIDSIYDDVGPIQGPVARGGVTDDSQPTLKGTAEAGSKVTVYDNGAPLGETKADASGNWTFTPAAPISEGPHDFTVDATDAAGNTGPKSDIYSITTDYTPPRVENLAITGVLDNFGTITGNIERGGNTDDKRPVISGKGDQAGDVIIVYTKDINGNHEIGRTTVEADGTWKLQPGNDLISGLNELTAVEQDPAGNQTVPCPPYGITLFTGAPPAPVIINVLDDVGPYTGYLQKGDVTDDNQPTFHGTAQPGTTVKLYDSDGTTLIGSGMTDPSGNWTITTDKLADGEHKVTATATDSVGLVSDRTGDWNFTVDTTPPDNVKDLVITDDVGSVTGPLYNNDTTDDNTPTFSGTAEPNGKVIIYDDGKQLGEAKVGADGKWEFTPTSPLKDGDHNFTTEVLDQAGNSSGQGNLTHIIIDTKDVLVSITDVIDNVGSITGVIASNGVTDDARPEIHGTGKAGSTVTIKDGTSTLGTATIDSSGNWTFKPSSDLADGLHSITAFATDATGTESKPTAPFKFTVDTIAPDKPTIDSIEDDVGSIQGPVANGGVTDDSTPTLLGKAEAGSKVIIYDNNSVLGSVMADPSGHWSFTPTSGISEGKHDFTATATDEAGNTSPKSDVYSIITDYTAPDAPVIVSVFDDVGDVTGNLKPGDTTDDDQPKISGTAEANSKVEIYDGTLKLGTTLTDASGNWSFTPTNPLGRGDHSITAKAIDAAGNVSNPSDKFDFIVDTDKTTTPAITHVIDSVGSITGDIVNGGFTDDKRPEIQGTADAGSKVTVYDNGTKLGETTAGADGKWSFKPTSDLADGTYNITATSTGASGNTSAHSNAWTFTVDTVAPEKPTIDSIYDDVGPIQGPVARGGVTDDSQPTLKGTAEAGSKVTVYDNGAPLGETKADASGNWTFTPAAPISEGPHDFTVDATDAAGNTGPKSDIYSITTDYTPPEVLNLAITGVLDSVGTVTGNVERGTKTDDTRPVISGKGDKAGDVIIVFTKDSTGNHEIGRTTVEADGTWKLQPATILISGDNQLTAIEQDPAGNQTVPCPPYDIVIDTGKPFPPVIVNVYDDVGPYQGYLQKGDLTDDNQPTFNGTAQPGSTVKLYDTDGTTLIGSATTDANGNWSITTDKLSDGLHEVIATATNGVGVVSDPTGKWNFIVDTTAPDNVKNLVILDDVGAVTGPLYNNDTTDDSRPTFSGDAEPNGKVIIYGNNDKLGEAKVDANGKWTFTPTQDLKDGPYDFTTEVLDQAGNSSGKGNPTHITIDTSQVGIKITHVIDSVGSITGDIALNGVTDDTRPEIQGTAKAGSTVTLYDNSVQIGTTIVKSDGTWSFKPTSDLAEGYHVISTLATDLAGNTSAPANYSFTVDTIAPDKPTIDSVYDDVGSIQGPVANGGVTDDSTPTLSGKAEALSKVTLFDNGGILGSVMADKDGNWSFTPTSGISEGKHDFTATATDEAGNTSPKSDVYSITTDYTAPAQPTIDSVYADEGYAIGNIANGGDTDDPTPVISGKAEAGSTVVIRDDGKEIGRVTADKDGKWSFTPTTGLPEGVHKLTAEATDAAGNTSVPSERYDFSVIPNGDDYPATVDTKSPVTNYTVVLDTSGSMSGTGITSAKTALLNMMNTIVSMGAKATLNLITFADSATDKGTFTFSKATDTGYTDLLKVVNALSAVGGTNYVSALTKATANITAEMTAGTVANKQVFFISDGNPTTSPTAAQLTTWQNLMANPPGGNSSIPVTTIGLGSGISDVYLSKITTSKTIMTPSATQLDDILQANLFVGSVSGNVLLNDAKLTLDGKETISQVAYDGTVYKVVNGVLQVDKPNADVTSSYDAATGRLVLDSGMGVLTLYMKANSSNKAGDYIYQLRSGQLTTGTAITDNYVYTGVDSAGHTQTATLHINALVDNNITGAIVVQAMGKDSGVATDFITSDGDAGRLITGTVAKTLAAGNYLEVSTDGGKTWTKVTAYDGKQWAFVDKSAHTADWTIQVRVADNNGNSGFLTNQAVTQVAALHAPTITSIPKADDGLLTSTEANTAVDMVVSLGNTGAKAGDIVHVQWGVGLYDQALTAADIAAGSVTVSVPRTVTYTEQGVAYDFNVIASIVSNGVAGASSSAYRVVGGGFSTKAISDTFAANSAGSVANNVYTGTDFTVTTSGTGMAKTAAVSANHYAGLTLSDTSSANATVNLSQPATKFSVTLSGIDLAKSGATIYVYGVDGKELSQQVVTSTTYYKAFSYTAPTGVDVGSFKVVAGSDAVTLSGFSFTEALHVGDTRALSIDHLTDTFYGTGSDDTALLKYAASSYLASTSNQGIHGGDGVDTLKVENYNQTLDLTLSTSKGKITSMEIIDLTSTNASYGNTLKLSVQDVLENGQTDLFHSTSKNTVQMMVKGDAKSVVNLDDLLGANGPDYGDWANTGSVSVAGTSYNTYQHSGLDAELLVQQGVKVNLI